MTKLFALIDCNNFFASCERVFRPDLEGRPVAVLSNNDGCIIARSAEVKALGIPMGLPYFKAREQLRRAGVEVFSSNYELYGDLSARVMAVLAGFSPEVEIYSVDEAFLGLDGFASWNVEAHMRALRATVKRWIGIPVSIGVAPTKTLAKLAAERAKKDASGGGVLVLTEPDAIRAARRATEVGDVWGVGRQWTKRFKALGVYTAEDFAVQSEHWVRGRMGVTGARTQAELLGRVCLTLDTQPAARQSCVASRSFAAPLTELDDVRAAIATFAARASERLRSGGLVAGQAGVFLLTDRFHAAAPQRTASAVAALDGPSGLTADITRAALSALARAWRSGFAYKKAGVMLLDLGAAAHAQPTLFDAPRTERAKAERLQRALDALNGGDQGKHGGGRDLVRLGAAGVGRHWRLRSDRRSPRYTTQWAELRGVM